MTGMLGLGLYKTKKKKKTPWSESASELKTPWPESAGELYRPGDRRLSTELVLTFADTGVLHSQRGGSLRP
jgi:hypothetical protein